LRGNRKLKSTCLDVIDDPHGDYARAGTSGHDRGPQYPYTMEDIRRPDAEVEQLLSNYTHPDRVSSSSVPRQESSSSAPPAETNEKVHTCVHRLKYKKPRKSKKRKNLSEDDVMEARKREADRLIPKFEVGEKVRFASEDGKEWLYGIITLTW
jgi:hypothetical protein